jgi:hypothetical protein
MIFVVVVVESVVRVFTVNTPAGPEFANTLLFTRSRKNVFVHNRATLARASAHGHFSWMDSRDVMHKWAASP